MNFLVGFIVININFPEKTSPAMAWPDRPEWLLQPCAQGTNGKIVDPQLSESQLSNIIHIF